MLGQKDLAMHYPIAVNVLTLDSDVQHYLLRELDQKLLCFIPPEEKDLWN